MTSTPSKLGKTTAGKVTWQSLFHAGLYAEVVTGWEAGDNDQQSSEEISFVIGAFSFLGRLDEADGLLQKYEGQMSAAALAQARFFLAVAFTRHLNSDKAKSLLLANLKLRSNRQNPIIQCYLALGLMFYRYTYGRLTPALRHAKSAYATATANRLPYEAFLAADTLGHAEINTGKIAQGMATLRRAKALASTFGHGANNQAADVTIGLYASTFGIADETQDLEYVYASLRFKDTYTAGQVGLEMARNYLLAGNTLAAERVFNDIRKDIFEFGNLRAQILYNLRFANFLYHVGETDEALVVAKETLAHLETNNCADLRLHLALRGLIYKIAPTTTDLSLIKRLTLKSGDQKSLRISQRIAAVDGDLVPTKSEDVIGDMIDGAKRKNAYALRQCVAEGKLGILAEACSLAPGAKAIVFGMIGNSCTAFARGSVAHIAEGLTDMQQKLLLSLQQGPKSPQDLVQDVWREQYRSARHDAVLSSFVSRLRAALPLFENLVCKADGNFRLAPEVSVRYFKEPTVATVTNISRETSQSECLLVDFDLNTRQQEFMRCFAVNAQQAGFDVNKYRRHFGISSSSALRDLRDLVTKKKIRVSGQGRLTHYYFV